jgi:hypothetical protein
MARDLESYRDGIDVGRKQMRAELEQLKAAHALVVAAHEHAQGENERLRASLRELFLLAQMSDQIRNDCPQMRKAGNLLALGAQAKG